MGNNSGALILVGFLMMAFFIYQAEHSEENYNQGTVFLMIMAFLGFFLASIGAFFYSGSTIMKAMSLICAIGSLFMIGLFVVTL